MTATVEPWVDELLAFWFGELTPGQWFKRSDEVDAATRTRFLGLYDQLAREAEASRLTPADARTALAAIIALDQLPRNLFRGASQAFATDPAALTLARQAVRQGLDKGLSVHERLFLYLPFEHSENSADQDTSVRLISALGDAELTRFAVRHQEIIVRFGRFPHRNAILGRLSTPEELAFLQEPDSAF